MRLTSSGVEPVYQVVDPVKASYGVENPIYAVVQLAQTTMRSELGKVMTHPLLVQSARNWRLLGGCTFRGVKRCLPFQ